jgi:4'-phosphopantetheinyl transferase
MIEPMRCDVWWARPTEETPTLYDLLDEVERGRYAGYRREADKLRFLTGRALIRTAAAQAMDIAPGDVTLDSSCFDCGKPHGKPRVVDSTLEVSISHSGDWIALAMTEALPVGIDVEEIRPVEVDDLAGICFSPTELTVFKAVPETERRGAFFTYWSRKEAVLKATGKGMSVPMSKLTLTAHDVAPRVVATEASEVDVTRTRMADLDRGPAYRACVALFADEPPEIAEHEGSELLARMP